MPSLTDLARAYRSALAAELAGTSFDAEDGEGASVITFVHPAHGATCLAVVEAHPALGATLLAAVVIGDAAEFAQPQSLLSFLAFNAQLMTCAVSAVPLNDDELALALVRRVPASELRPEELGGLFGDMIWEWAQVTAQAVKDTPGGPSAAAPQKPRLIGSLDEL